MIKIETNHGTITIELDADKAPITAANFKKYIEGGLFDNTIFHRVIPNFMIQGGGFEPGMTQKKTLDPVENEADNGLGNDRGTIAMARTSDPHSATAQFFINLKDNDFLNHTETRRDGVIVFLPKSRMAWM
jgi:peptidyl-prolyl cis-trans isomerase B (cyclophilin B)